MNKLLLYCILAVFALVGSGITADYTSPNTDPSGTSGNTTYSQLDAFGDIIGTIPSANPGPSNAWVGMAWANGYLYTFKNVVSAAPQMLQINPSTGAILNTYTLPFSGYVMDATYDGSGFFVAQWSATNVIWKVSLTGTSITSFVPVTGGYSARCPNWDGTNLWVGCNLSSNSTKLIKMTSAGVNVQEWMTGSAVGWYMGGEFSTNAPTGANLYVVDNVGNTIKRLNVGATVTVAAQVASPAASPDVAEGLTFDGEYLWHCGAYASAGVIWKLDDGFPGGPPVFSLTLAPLISPIVIPANGGSFSFFAFITNGGTAPATATLWTKWLYPNGTMSDPLLGPRTITIPVGTIAWMRSQNVPATAPPGNYTYFGYVGTYPNTVWDTSAFAFSKSATADNGPFVWDATCSGDLLPGEVLDATPATHVVLSNYPNPFNPSTTIRFALNDAGIVNLTVFDVTGRQVANLVNGYRDSGQHDVTFDGSNLSSGLYWYRLTANGQTSTAKMILMK